MPSLFDENLDLDTFGANTGIKFSGIRPENITSFATTLVGIAVDCTGSMNEFTKALDDSVGTIVDLCQKCPESENLMLRVTAFESSSVKEVHGFAPFSAINKDGYQGAFYAGGMTNLYDASHEILNSVYEYSKKLREEDYKANGIVFVITDGEDNRSKTSVSEIADLLSEIRRSEMIDSIQFVLVGINDSQCKSSLDKFAKDATFDHYISVGAADVKKLQTLVGWVSQAISSTSQVLNSRQPSQLVGLTF